MTFEEIVAKVNEIMVEGFEIEPELLEPEAQLADDLGLDSLDAVDLVVALEKEFGFRIDEERARSMRILKDIYDYVEEEAARAKDQNQPPISATS